MRPLLYVVAALLLLVGTYVFGRCDAPGKDEAQAQSLIDGMRAYRDRLAQLERQKAQLARGLSASKKRERDLAARRTPTPTTTPAACAPWADNLSTCDQQRGELESQITTAGELLALARVREVGDSARMDSVTAALKREVGKGKFLGIKLPSRKTSLLTGGVAGVVVCLLVQQPC